MRRASLSAGGAHPRGPPRILAAAAMQLNARTVRLGDVPRGGILAGDRYAPLDRRRSAATLDGQTSSAEDEMTETTGYSTVAEGPIDAGADMVALVPGSSVLPAGSAPGEVVDTSTGPPGVPPHGVGRRALSATAKRDPMKQLTPVRVLTVDDQVIFRQVAREVIVATDGFDAVGEAASGEEALDAVERLAPQLVLLDVRMPGMDGIEVARQLVACHPEVVVVLISLEESVDLPSAGQLGRLVPFVRKQDFGPKLLRRLWSEHRNVGDAPRPAV
jgi:CheY-like chemotaxis protein